MFVYKKITMSKYLTKFISSDFNNTSNVLNAQTCIILIGKCIPVLQDLLLEPRTEIHCQMLRDMLENHLSLLEHNH